MKNRQMEEKNGKRMGSLRKYKISNSILKWKLENLKLILAHVLREYCLEEGELQKLRTSREILTKR